MMTPPYTGTVMTIHTFEQSGLGKAPFTITTASEQAKDAGAVFWCEHCGTQLKNRYFVKSADNRVSVVGIDCLKKTGDAGLIAGAKRLQREAKANLIATTREQEAAKRAELERQRNGGLSNWDMAEKIAAEIKEKRAAFPEKIVDHVVLKSLTKDGFELSMKQKALSGEPFSLGMLNTIKDIHTKKVSNARAGSAAFCSHFQGASAEVTALQSILEEFKREIDSLQSLRGTYLSWHN